jgi:hypothetical protein
MSEHVTNTGSGQRITTNYEPQERTNYEGTAKGDSRREGESRVEQNRRLRDESRNRVSSRPDSHENLKKEKKRKAEVEDKLIAGREKVRDRQVTEEFRESDRKKKEKAATAASNPKPSGPIDNIGRSVSRYVGQNNGMPVWMNPPGKNGMPIWMTGGGGGKMPAWVMGGPAPWEPKAAKRAPPRRHRNPPQPKSTRPAWIKW